MPSPGLTSEQVALSEKMLLLWGKLTLDEVNVYHASPSAFYAILNARYGLIPEHIEMAIQDLRKTLEIAWSYLIKLIKLLILKYTDYNVTGHGKNSIIISIAK